MAKLNQPYCFINYNPRILLYFVYSSKQRRWILFSGPSLIQPTSLLLILCFASNHVTVSQYQHNLTIPASSQTGRQLRRPKSEY